MTAIRTVLIATDFSHRAARAEVRAAALCAVHRPSRIELVTVKEAEEPAVLAQVTNSTESAAKASITERTMRELGARAAILKDSHGIDCSQGVRYGHPAVELVAHANELDANLIVVGAHGGNFFSDLLLGNTADKLVHLCTRPLLIVKNEPRHAYRNVLVPVDFSEDSRCAAEFALLAAPDAHVTFLHAFTVPFEGQMQYAGVSTELINEYRVRAREDARVKLNEFIDALQPGGKLVSRAISFGMAHTAVREQANASKPDLIVIGKHGRSRFEELIIGSVTRDAIEQTTADILVVPAAARGV